MPEFSEKAFKEFVAEAGEMISRYQEGLLDMDESFSSSGVLDQDILNEIFRAAHSLKGAAGMFGLEDLSKLSHALENMLDNLRLGKIEYNSDVFDVLFQGGQKLSEILEKLSRKEEIDRAEVESFISEIDDAIKRNKKTTSENLAKEAGIDPEILAVLTEYEEHRINANLEEGKGIYRVKASFPLEEFDVRLEKLTSSLKEIGEVITTLPSSEPASEGELRFDMVVATDASEEKIKSHIGDEKAQIELLGKLKREPPKKKALKKNDIASSLTRKSDYVRVNIEKLDYIMSLVGELGLSKSAIERSIEVFKDYKELAPHVLELQKNVKLLERKLRELQNGITEIRMVPLSMIFNNLARIVNKLARDSGKEINLEIYGADTELDKLIVEELSDPLIHIIRNAIDHGIESKEERLLAGKPEKGTIIINAYQKGNHVVIEISDDGRGIDVEKVRKKAIEKGIISPDEELSREEIINLIFTPGFSTKEEVSEISGRGVGMDVVKNNITRLSGMINVVTEEGKGTTFIITLPITLAIIQALLIKFCHKIFAIPLNSILETVVITPDEIKTVEKKEVIELRDITLPVIRPGKIFNLTDCPEDQQEYFIIVVGLAEKKWGILVDQIIGQQDVVIKPLGKSLSYLKPIAGATDLGDQRVVLVIDVASFIEEAEAYV